MGTVSIVKSEWHQVEKRYGIEIDHDLLTEIYPDKEEDEITVIFEGLENGTYDVEDVIQEAQDNGVDLDWDYLNEDDWWTDRKGGYDVTYKVEEWEVHKEYVPPITHKCTNCKWTGDRWSAHWQWEDSEGNKLADAIRVCPMCDNLIELTEVGIEKEKNDAERKSLWAKKEQTSDDFPSDEELAEEKKELDAMLEQLKENAAWPFPSKDEPIAPTLYPAGEYTIRIWGRTREVGVGKITKAQYDHWSKEYSNDLGEALNESYDYEDNDTPEEARFNQCYYDYNDVKSFWGFDEDDTHMTVTNSDGEEIYEGPLYDFISIAFGDDDFGLCDATEEEEELYPEYLGKGCFVMWTQGGKGSCIQTTIDTEGQEFDPRKLRYTTWDIQGSSCVNRLYYDGLELEDEGMDSEHENWRGQWADYSVHENLTD
jgi:hypothetical protein